MRSDKQAEKIIRHKGQEENLLAAKRALRQYRGAWLNRRLDLGGDVLDIIWGDRIVERHCSCSSGCFMKSRPVEDLVMYR